jgi:hypothetical protein
MLNMDSESAKKCEGKQDATQPSKSATSPAQGFSPVLTPADEQGR